MVKPKRKKRTQEALDIIGPTPELMAQAEFTRPTLAYRRIPVIDTLSQTGAINQRQFDGLSRYRDIGIKCERSPTMDSCQRLLHVSGGNGSGPTNATVSAWLELGWLERELGALVDIARAVAIGDMTVRQWAIKVGGAIERDGKIHPRRICYDTAMIEIKTAGDRLAAAIAA